MLLPTVRDRSLGWSLEGTMPWGSTAILTLFLSPTSQTSSGIIFKSQPHTWNNTVLQQSPNSFFLSFWFHGFLLPPQIHSLLWLLLSTAVFMKGSPSLNIPKPRILPAPQAGFTSFKALAWLRSQNYNQWTKPSSNKVSTNSMDFTELTWSVSNSWYNNFSTFLFTSSPLWLVVFSS